VVISRNLKGSANKRVGETLLYIGDKTFVTSLKQGRYYLYSLL